MNQIYSVREISKYIKNLFDQDYLLNQVSVRGEISGWKDHPSGHLYFNLRDAESTIPVVMFQSARLKGLKTAPREGMKVVVTGSIELYMQGGKYQLYARTIEEDGEGERYREFLKLKAKLEEMGMFDPAYKKPIPKYAMTIGVVTATSGAALQDVIRVTGQRNPYVQLILSPAVVQGPEAPKSIVRAIQKLDAVHPDVMIVGRGGGSYETLQAYNDPRVAEAVYACETPVISAVGHEYDVTIIDLAADVRAATPTDAGAKAAWLYRDYAEEMDARRRAMDRCMQRALTAAYDRSGHARERLRLLHPQAKLADKKEKCERLRLRMSECMLRLLQERRRGLSVREDLTPAMMNLAARYRRELSVRERLTPDAMAACTARRHRLEVERGKLAGFAPGRRLAEGMAFVTDMTGGTVAGAAALTPGQTVRMLFADGTVRSQVTDIALRNGEKG